MLPVSRPTLWLGKASFAIVSTFGLAAVLVLMSLTATEVRTERFGLATILDAMGTFLVEGIAWSLLWSSWSRNTLVARRSSGS